MRGRGVGEDVGWSAAGEKLNPFSPADERRLLERLAEYRGKLDGAMHSVDDSSLSACENPEEGGRWGAIARRYEQIRAELALSHMRLVAHLAKRFRNRGVAYADLLQEGFCGLLEAIDRFDLEHTTRLGTYAGWWVRQAMQQAVAGGAYPVRLSPRHLRQLAQERQGQPPEEQSDPASAETLDLLRRAIRPAVSINATCRGEGVWDLADDWSVTNGPDEEERRDLRRLLDTLSPREARVLALRFGLGGQAEMSLSEVGAQVGISKERVRQIQDKALNKLRHTTRRGRPDRVA